MIPAEAVEAAAKVMFDQSHVGEATEWAYVREEYRTLVRSILEAAAPHMLADVWAVAYRKGIDDILRDEINEPSPNPYRSTP